MSELRQLDKMDVLFVAGETRKVYQHTAGLVLLDCRKRPDFSFENFREHFIDRVSRVPHFRWKLHEVPLGLDLPYWVEDEKFNFDHHIRRIAVPSPGDREALGEVVAHLYSSHLDRSRPLWEIWFIEGLPDGQFAILQKLHHAVMDGEGASKLGEILCDFEPDAEPQEIDPSIANASAGATPSQWQQSLNTTRRLARLPLDATREILGFVQPRLLQRITGRDESGKDRPPIPVASFNAAISADRGFVFGSLPLDPIKRIKNHFGVTVNDVVLALVGTSMREYLLQYSVLNEESLRASIAACSPGSSTARTQSSSPAVKRKKASRNPSCSPAAPACSSAPATSASGSNTQSRSAPERLVIRPPPSSTTCTAATRSEASTRRALRKLCQCRGMSSCSGTSAQRGPASRRNPVR